ncbi:rhizoferrin export MFS transporter FslB [Francisella adeliensis]|uniref:MFS transporter n=1 Tax=Francisella adeliensis TaxID=2007306 RepID=A0A2Z4Y0C8_9GAMM|nr:rhizoferrin export MFS transporter FslB [Francisella adeliensis]AXA34611.1 MFS transporter [Francisella adeliensis]MBK2086337.1 MFS transporter [Francisella adeliensis]MBK2096552.1 MFS transporter [Francisella adeliensis]QIW12855.1 multidrug efflux MFS transporter [Francisella adeliensis]QIW14732.1 multidrug efflux MFS transporter [Francisella adeliensis]
MCNTVKTQIILLCCCQLVVIAAMEMSNPFLPIYLHSLSNFGLLSANTWSILAYALPLISAIISSPFWGKYGDRFGYKTMILRAAGALAIIQLLIYLTDSVVIFITLRFIQGAIAGFLLASQSYAVVLVSKEYRSRVLAWLQSSTAIGIAIGPLIGGVFASIFSYNTIFLISALAATLTFTVLCLKLKKVNSHFEPKKHKNIHSKQSKRNTSAYFYFSVIFLSIFLAQTAKFLPQSFFAVYAENFFNSSPIVIGAIYAAPAFSLLLISAPLGLMFDKLLKKIDKQYFFASGYFITLFMLAAIAISIHATTHNIYLIIIARLILGASFAGTLPCLFSLACRAKDAGFGHLIGYCNTFSKFGNLSGIFLGGMIFQLCNMQTVFYLTSFIYLLLVIMYACLFYLFDQQKLNLNNKEISQCLN